MKKAFFKSLGDRIGSRINEELFVYAYCEKKGYNFEKIIDPWSYIDKKSIEPRNKIHKKMLDFLCLPQDIVYEFFSEDYNDEWIEIKEGEYNAYKIEELFNEAFIEKTVKKYRENRKNDYCKNLEEIVVSVHIRRGDVNWENTNRYLPNSYYQNIIDKIQKNYPKAVVNIFSDTAYQTDDKVESLTEFSIKNYNLFIDYDMEKTWEIMIDSDILIMSKSSFSWVPAMYNQNLVIYPECWLKKLPKWVNSKDNDLEKKITLYINERFSG